MKNGELSAYNILYWKGNIALIDFPQVVQPEGNPVAWSIFRRDVTRVCQYFGFQGVQSNPHKLSADLWTAHGYKIVKRVYPPYLDADNPKDRQAWDRQS